MSGILKIKISETTDELKELLKSIKNQKVKERVQVLYWLKSEQVQTENAIAKLTGKHRTRGVGKCVMLLGVKSNSKN